MAKKYKKNKTTETTVEQSIIDNVTNAKIVKTLEDQAKLDTTPAGDYEVETHAGPVRVRKSETGRVTWQLNGEQITRSALYAATKVEAQPAPLVEDDDNDDEVKPSKKKKKGKKGKKDKKAETETENGEVLDGPDSKCLEKIYKKKQLMNILKTGKAGTTYKKRVLKAIEQAIPEKKISGSAFIAAMDDGTGEEVSVETINAVFAALAE